jgi:hypothetical protein
MEKFKSIGCVDYGNNNFWEIMKECNTGEIILESHDDPPGVEQDDGTQHRSEHALSLEQFLEEISDRPDYNEIVEDLQLSINNSVK